MFLQTRGSDGFGQAVGTGQGLAQGSIGHPGAIAPPANHQIILFQPGYGVADGGAAHPVFLHQICFGGETLVQLTGRQPSPQVGLHLSPQGQSAGSV